MLLLGKRCPMSIHYFFIRRRSCRLPRRGLAITVVAAIAISLFCDQFGTYTVQPLGAVPEGATYVVRRIKGEPFFNSIDGTCDRWGEEVTVSFYLEFASNFSGGAGLMHYRTGWRP